MKKYVNNKKYARNKKKYARNKKKNENYYYIKRSLNARNCLTKSIKIN